MENKTSNLDLVTIYTANQPTTANLIEGFLENEGITVFLQHEMTAQLYGNTVGGVNIQVPECEAEKASNLLKENGYLE